MQQTGLLCAMSSEEHADLIEIPPQFDRGEYFLAFDPLDGSSNIDANVSIGTIFGIYRRKNPEKKTVTLEDVLQKGAQQVAAGYIIYGSSTMLVYTTGNGVHGFTLDPGIGEFLLSHPNMRIPEQGRTCVRNATGTRAQFQTPFRFPLRHGRSQHAGTDIFAPHRHPRTDVRILG